MFQRAIKGGGQIVANGFGRMAAVDLQHGTHRTLLARHHNTFATVEQDFAVQHDIPALRLKGAGDQAEYSAFAGAGFTKQTDPSSEITPRELFYARRIFIQLAGGVSLSALLPRVVWAGDKLADVGKLLYGNTDSKAPNPS